MTLPTTAQQSAYDLLVNTLRMWGLEELAPDVLALLQDGKTEDQIPVLLQQTEAYKKRFSANATRIKNGLAALSPAEYLSVERSYRQILSANGMPTGFYDSPSDFADWIGKDVAPTEVQQRVGFAVDAAQRLDEGTKRAFQEFYNVGMGDLAAFFLDQDRALPLVQKQARAARIGGIGYNDGATFGRDIAEHLATSTIVSDGDIDSAVGTAAGIGRDAGFLGQLYGDRSYDTSTAAEEVFFASTDAERRRRKLTDAQAADFNAQAGIGRGSLSRDSGLY